MRSGNNQSWDRLTLISPGINIKLVPKFGDGPRSHGAKAGAHVPVAGTSRSILMSKSCTENRSLEALSPVLESRRSAPAAAGPDPFSTLFRRSSCKGRKRVRKPVRVSFENHNFDRTAIDRCGRRAEPLQNSARKTSAETSSNLKAKIFLVKTWVL